MGQDLGQMASSVPVHAKGGSVFAAILFPISMMCFVTLQASSALQLWAAGDLWALLRIMVTVGVEQSPLVPALSLSLSFVSWSWRIIFCDHFSVCPSPEVAVGKQIQHLWCVCLTSVCTGLPSPAMKLFVKSLTRMCVCSAVLLLLFWSSVTAFLSSRLQRKYYTICKTSWTLENMWWSSSLGRTMFTMG